MLKASQWVEMKFKLSRFFTDLLPEKENSARDEESVDASQTMFELRYDKVCHFPRNLPWVMNGS